MDLFSLRPAVPAAQQCFPAACRPSVAGFYVRVECGDSFDMPAGIYLVNRSWDRRVPRRRRRRRFRRRRRRRRRGSAGPSRPDFLGTVGWEGGRRRVALWPAIATA